jgi:hypothetical protein
MDVRIAGLVVIALCIGGLAGCGQQGSTGSTRDQTGIVGRVHLGPQCPVERAGHPCPDKPPEGSTVTVAKRGSGDIDASRPVVARTTTDAHGHFHVAVPPGMYVVTADAGMSCETVVARVRAGGDSHVDISCDTGIR